MSAMKKNTHNHQPSKPTYAIGIDLGTTNSELAYLPLDQEKAKTEILAIPQLVAPSTTESRPMLPSFLFLPAIKEGNTYDLPWAKNRTFAVGDFARKQAAEQPSQTISAAKSWLCYSRVDRRKPILPWNAPEDTPKVSPVEATQHYLEHLAGAWNSAFPDSPIADQQVTLTVPASFDASARDLTREAARLAGLPENLVLLEEPQAALYAWLADKGEKWRRHLKLGNVLLVCDVGGGTTDFTLISVEQESGDLQLSRLAVGNHILVGGDNMDLTLAHLAKDAFTAKGAEVNPWQAVALWHSCRNAKESLLGENPPEQVPVTILGRGSRVIKGAISIDLQRDIARQTLVDGFFPMCALTDRPARARTSGFREIGLPFESDPAITRHLAQFLSAQGSKDGQPIKPTHILFNGGVLKAPAFQKRLLDVFQNWFGQTPQIISGNNDLDFAVARGAAYYGRIKQGSGIRIRGGTARSYYVGIETSGPAIPGAHRPLRALCVVPKGIEEGSAVKVPSEPIGLVVGEPARFRFFSSAMRKDDKAGALIGQWTEDEIGETDSLESALPSSEKSEDGYVPVTFESHITELGVLELWCASTLSDERWKLEFRVRDDAETN